MLARLGTGTAQRSALAGTAAEALPAPATPAALDLLPSVEQGALRTCPTNGVSKSTG